MSDDKTFDLRARAQMPSLTDPEVAGAALEMFLEPDDRVAGGLAFLLCDRDGKLLQPILVDDVPDPVTTSDRRAALQWAIGLCTMVGDEHSGPLGLLLAITRETGPVCDGDRAWHQVALDACAQADVPLLGVHVVTLHGALALPTAPRAA